MPDAYIDIVFADAYHAKYTNDSSVWTSSSAGEKEAAIVQATQFIDLEYERLMKGKRSVAGQDLAYPRVGVRDLDGYSVDSTTVPLPAQQATAEVAIRVRIDPTLLMPDESSTGTVAKTSIKVGPISESITYTAGNQDKAVRAKVNAILRPLLKPQGRLSRG